MIRSVSCIIPTHRRPDQLEESMRSVMAQSIAPLELIVVDDADDAPTRALVERLRGETPIPLVMAANPQDPGASGSRNVGARLARGSHLAFLDDDDAWAAAYLEQAMALIGDTGSDAVVTGQQRFRTDGAQQTIIMPLQAKLAQCVYQRNPGMTGSNLLIGRDAFWSLGGFDPGLPAFNDWDLLIRFHEAGLTYAVQPEPLMEWREHLGDRISTPTLRRANGIDLFLAKHGVRLPRHTQLRLKAVVLSIRRQHSGSGAQRAGLLAQSVLVRLERSLHAGAGRDLAG